MKPGWFFVSQDVIVFSENTEEKKWLSAIA
jgi:hypothetical protein